MAPLNYKKIFRVVLLGMVCTRTAAQLLKKKEKTHICTFSSANLKT
jgi:hypothetical protein